MTYLLDTNTVIALLKNHPLSVRRRLQRAASEASLIAIPSVVLFELWYGVARSERPRENTERLRVFLSGAINVLPFEEEDAAAAGNLRAALDAVGTPIGPYDVLIAAQALRIGATLVSANVREFTRVRGLRWQNWTASR